MTCMEARDLLLVAEPDALRGADDSELAAHIRSCAECAGAARTIIEMNMRLDHALGRIVERSTAAQESAELDKSAETPSHTRAVVPLWKRKRAPGRASAYMAAAAVLCIAVAGVMLQRHVARSAGESYPLHIPERQTLAAPVVNTTQAGAVAVIRTNNPKITVVWYLQPRRGKS
jgi:hypothetical protein